MFENAFLWTVACGLLVPIVIAAAIPELREMIRVTLFGSSNSGSGVAFDRARDIPSLADKVVLITGGSGGLGRQTVLDLAKYGRPARIYIADLPREDSARRELIKGIDLELCRNDTGVGRDGKSPMTEVRFLDLDLTSFDSVRKCASAFIAKEERLDMLMLNSGIIRIATGQTKEGYEVHFGLNYLGHALLAKLLVPTMTGFGARIVVVASEGHNMAPEGGIAFEKLKTDCADLVNGYSSHTVPK
jgi:retinol dehydrogenase 12